MQGMTYSEDEFLQLSGIQHFRFCKRQWALIHIEKQWAENYRTVDGTLMHKNAHNQSFRESRNGLLVTRGVSVFSFRLGLSGQCDVLEYHQNSFGIPIKGKEGLWRPFPVEYKRGSPRDDNADELQLCGQAMCLEEMLCCDIPEGAIYYGEMHHRVVVRFTVELREEVQNMVQQMHDLFSKGYTPQVKPSKFCNACSLKELCLPKLTKMIAVSTYIKKAMEGTL